MRTTEELSAWVRDARRRTLEMAAGLDEGQLMGPRLPIVNPMRWEIGHVAWFQERWVLRHAARPGEGFVFDNEKWAHAVTVAPFRIARAPVTAAELAAFVEDGGYRRRELWSAEGWAWRAVHEAVHPFHWRRGPEGWQRRDF